MGFGFEDYHQAADKVAEELQEVLDVAEKAGRKLSLRNLEI